jgi:hypothetical protein
MKNDGRPATCGVRGRRRADDARMKATAVVVARSFAAAVLTLVWWRERD